jgi:hypothetical protein
MDFVIHLDTLNRAYPVCAQRHLDLAETSVMTKDTHPLELVGWLAEQHRDQNATTQELVAILEKAQLTMEEDWKWGAASGEDIGCHFRGRNYHRYPASLFCMYHVTGHDTFAARLRRSIKRDKARGVDVSEFDSILRLITENIVNRR